MKTLTLTNTGTAALPLFVGEETPPAWPSKQVTVAHVTPEHPQWSRNIQLTDQFLFFKRYGSKTVGIHVDDLIKMAVAIEPSLSYPPLFTVQPVASQSVAAGAPFPALTVAAESELDETYQWQSLSGEQWSDVAGATSLAFTPTVAGVYSCLATNAAGATRSFDATVSVQTPPAPKTVANGPLPVNTKP